MIIYVKCQLKNDLKRTFFRIKQSIRSHLELQLRGRVLMIINSKGLLFVWILMSWVSTFLFYFREKAEEAGLDLVRVSPNANPPVCKIIDFGKFRYELARKEKDAKKKQKVVEIKEVRLSPNIEENDLNTKVNQARKFLQKGNRVKVTLRFRGRELAYVNQSKVILDNFAELLSDISTVDKQAKFEGRSMFMFLAAKTSK